MSPLAECRRWLEAALARTTTAPQRARVQLLLTAFEGYEDAALYYSVNTKELPPEQLLQELLDSDPPASQKRKAQELLAVLRGRVPAVSRNVSFEEGAGDEPPNWFLWVKPAGDPPYGAIRWIESQTAPTGQRCLVVEGLRRGGPVQQIPAVPGRYVLVASYRWPHDQKDRGLEMSVILKDEGGRDLVFDRQPDATVVELVPGSWRKIARPFVVPSHVGPTKVTGVQFAAVIEGLAPDEKIYYDDIGVYRLGD